MSRKEKIGFFVALLVVAVAFLTIGVGLTASFNKVTPVEGAEDKPVTPAISSNSLASTQESFRSIVSAVKPAMCTVKVITRVPGGNYRHPWQIPDLNPFNQNPRIPEPAPRDFEVPSSGSGFVVSPEGYILTNNHVVQNASEIKIVLNGRDEYDAEIIGEDPDTDVAVLKIEGDEPFPYIEFGDSDEIFVGDWVLAIGNPFGYLDHSVTVGVISAKNRESITGAQYENFLQTDAAINLGNSGGPLVDIYGRAVGINTAITSQGSGIGFAVPINMARYVYEDFLEFGEVKRGWIGVTIEAFTEERAEELGLEFTEGAIVLSLSDDDPAQVAGLEVNDIIVGVEGEEIHSASQLSRIIAAKRVGETFEVTLIRDGKEMTFEIVPVLRGEDPIIHGGDNQLDIDELGFTIMDISKKMREDDIIPENVDGVIVYRIDTRSQAGRKGIEPGVIITHINNKKIDSVEEFVEEFDRVSDEKSVILDILFINDDGSTDEDVVALKLN